MNRTKTILFSLLLTLVLSGCAARYLVRQTPLLKNEFNRSATICVLSSVMQARTLADLMEINLKSKGFNVIIMDANQEASAISGIKYSDLSSLMGTVSKLGIDYTMLVTSGGQYNYGVKIYDDNLRLVYSLHIKANKSGWETIMPDTDLYPVTFHSTNDEMEPDYTLNRFCQYVVSHLLGEEMRESNIKESSPVASQGPDYFAQGKDASKKGDYQKAIDLYSKVPTVSTNYERAQHNIGVNKKRFEKVKVQNVEDE